MLSLFNRPSVVGVVLQTPSSFIKLLSHPFPPHLQDIINPKAFEPGSSSFERIFNPHHVSHATSQVPGFRCQVSGVSCQVSHFIYFIFTNSALWSSSHRVCLWVCVFVCLSPSRAIFFKASHWPSDHMTRSRPLIGQPPLPPWGKGGGYKKTCHLPSVICHLSSVSYHLSPVISHLSHVKCHMSHVTCYLSTVTSHV